MRPLLLVWFPISQAPSIITLIYNECLLLTVMIKELYLSLYTLPSILSSSFQNSHILCFAPLEICSLSSQVTS